MTTKTSKIKATKVTTKATKAPRKRSPRPVGSGQTCLCGCGAFTRGAKSSFCQGHDARLKAKLAKIHGKDRVAALVAAKGVASAFAILGLVKKGAAKSNGKASRVKAEAVQAPVAPVLS